MTQFQLVSTLRPYYKQLLVQRGRTDDDLERIECNVVLERNVELGLRDCNAVAPVRCSGVVARELERNNDVARELGRNNDVSRGLGWVERIPNRLVTTVCNDELVVRLVGERLGLPYSECLARRLRCTANGVWKRLWRNGYVQHFLECILGTLVRGVVLVRILQQERMKWFWRLVRTLRFS